MFCYLLHWRHKQTNIYFIHRYNIEVSTIEQVKNRVFIEDDMKSHLVSKEPNY